jgi:hypothetical protein
MKYLLLVLSLFVSTSWAQHGHLNVGAVGKNQGDKLNFNNGLDFLASSGYVKTLDFASSGKFSNYFNGNISLTAMHAFDGLGDPVPGSPAPGAVIEVEFVRVFGPVGGHFSFWDDAVSTNRPAITVPTGPINGKNRYLLSDVSLGAGEPGADPFGHIHGRRFTADKPGVYTVAFKAYDISTNGTAGGPIHTPSDVLDITFQAGYNLTTLTRTNSTAYITIGTATNFLFTLQVNTNLAQPTGWTNLTTLNGTDYFETVIDDQATSTNRFYRVTVSRIEQ